MLRRGTSERQRIRGNFRPRYTVGLRQHRASEAEWRSGDVEHNIREAIAMLEARGARAEARWDCQRGRAYALLGEGMVTLNPNHRFWGDPWAVAIETRRSGRMATSDPAGLVFHELVHAKDHFNRYRLSHPELGCCHAWIDPKQESIAKRVSQYSSRSPIEFVAETYAALQTGRKFDHEVMRLYRNETGRRPQRVKGLAAAK